MFSMSLLTAGMLAVLGPFVLSLFGPDFVIGYPTLLVVLTGLVLRSTTGPVEYLLIMRVTFAIQCFSTPRRCRKRWIECFSHSAVWHSWSCDSNLHGYA